MAVKATYGLNFLEQAYDYQFISLVELVIDSFNHTYP